MTLPKDGDKMPIFGPTTCKRVCAAAILRIRSAVITSQLDCCCFFITSLWLRYLDQSVSLHKPIVPLSWSHWSRSCGTCYRLSVCHVDVCRVYGKESVFLLINGNLTFQSNIADLYITQRQAIIYNDSINRNTHQH